MPGACYVLTVRTVLAGQCEYPSTVNNSTSSTINIAAPALAHGRSALLSPKINSLEPDVCVTLPWPVSVQTKRDFIGNSSRRKDGPAVVNSGLKPQHSQQNVPDAECPSHCLFLFRRIYLQIHFTKINL